jgi:hypothetical protein
MLLTSAPLGILALVMMLFHLGNGEMLPLLGHSSPHRSRARVVLLAAALSVDSWQRPGLRLSVLVAAIIISFNAAPFKAPLPSGPRLFFVCPGFAKVAASTELLDACCVSRLLLSVPSDSNAFSSFKSSLKRS